MKPFSMELAHPVDCRLWVVVAGPWVLQTFCIEGRRGRQQALIRMGVVDRLAGPPQETQDEE